MSEGLTPDRWERLRSLLSGALDRVAAEREAFVEAVCVRDPDLGAELEALLRAHEATGSLDDVARAIERAAMPPSAAREGRRIGAYRLVQPLGEGGMGAVYLAERVDGQFEQRAALKLLRAGVDSTDVRRRFLEERRILARLEHPNIARLLDGGITEDGQPYFVMEYVAGVPVTSYCRDAGLDVSARLRIFLQVCAAVHYAHRNLIVHRDLKPSNILVTADGQVKLLDFGIARLLADDPASPRTTQRWLTPDYAAPEQVRGEAVTTSSDVYALGVVLYEMLAGVRPYALETASPTEVERIVCGVDPPPPSATADPTFRIHIAGDLDTIVRQAMRKEPGARYAGAAALSDDVARHLDGLPVLARPATVGYRARKFVRRHRVAVAAAALVALTLGGGIAGTAWQASRAAAQARLAEQERDRARLEAAKADRVSDFLIDLFQVSDPGASLGEVVTARALLDSGALRIRSGLRAEPVVQATMMDVIGRIYSRLGLYAQADTLVHEGLTIRRRTLGETHPDVAESLTNVGRIAFDRGEYDAADTALRAALDIRRAALPDPHTDLAAAINNLGTALHAKRDLDGAERLYREALDMRHRLPGGDSLDLAVSLSNVAAVLKSRGELGPADSLLRASIAIRRRHQGDRHPDLADNLNNLGTLLVARGDLEGAAAVLREALAMRRSILGDDHPMIGQSLHNLASVMERMGDAAAAEPLYRESLALKRETLGDAHPSVATGLNNLGLLLVQRGDVATAEPLLRESLEIRRRAFGQPHRDVAAALQSLAALYRRKGDWAAAEMHYRRALDMRRDLLGDEHPDVATSALRFGQFLQERGRQADAEPLLRAAVVGRLAAFGGGSWQVADAEIALAETLEARGRGEEAAPIMTAAFERLRADSTSPPALLERVASSLAAFHERAGDAALAARFLAVARPNGR